jgi:hypothetical protein
MYWERTYSFQDLIGHSHKALCGQNNEIWACYPLVLGKNKLAGERVHRKQYTDILEGLDSNEGEDFRDKSWSHKEAPLHCHTLMHRCC